MIPSGIFRSPLSTPEKPPVENSLDGHLQAKQTKMAPLRSIARFESRIAAHNPVAKR